MSIVKILYFILIILFGVFIFVYGGYDDSPGAQLLGVIIVVVSILGIRKEKKKSSSSATP